MTPLSGTAKRRFDLRHRPKSRRTPPRLVQTIHKDRSLSYIKRFPAYFPPSAGCYAV